MSISLLSCSEFLAEFVTRRNHCKVNSSHQKSLESPGQLSCAGLMLPRSGLSKQAGEVCASSGFPGLSCVTTQVQRQNEAFPASSASHHPFSAASPPGPLFCPRKEPSSLQPQDLRAPPPLRPHPVPHLVFPVPHWTYGSIFGYSESPQAPGLVLSSQDPQCLHLGLLQSTPPK